MFTQAIQNALASATRYSDLLSIMEYAVLPAGKLFRPRLVEALALDLNQAITEDHQHLAVAIELHHAYTLVHDDLPAMDNDLIRRGKPSTHAQFGEWKAILAGDALLISSFQILMNIKNIHLRELHQLMTWATGAKGLIEGQFRDLAANGKLTTEDVIRIHELKTARLIQLATLGSYYLSEKINLKGKIEFLRLGREIGVSFQLLDDLSDLTDVTISDHEKMINPFIQNTNQALRELRNSHRRLTKIVFNHKLKHLEKMLDNYFKTSQAQLLENFSLIENKINGDASEIKQWLTTYV